MKVEMMGNEKMNIIRRKKTREWNIYVPKFLDPAPAEVKMWGYGNNGPGKTVLCKNGLRKKGSK